MGQRNARGDRGSGGAFDLVRARALATALLVAIPSSSPGAVDVQAEVDRCVEGDAAACGKAGLAYATGIWVAKDPARAAVLYQKACDGNDAGGCINLGILYEKGEGVAKDLGRATVLYQTACDRGGVWGCHNLGILYANGEGVARDLKRAADLYRKACQAGLQAGCASLEKLERK